MHVRSHIDPIFRTPIQLAAMLALAPPPSPERPWLVRQQLAKTKMCKIFKRQGICRDDCTYAHAEHDLKTMPNLEKTKLCSAWTRGQCAAAHCRFAHGVTELRGSTEVFKTSLCHWHSQHGKCNRGARCRHAHGESEIRPPEPVAARTGRLVYAV